MCCGGSRGRRRGFLSLRRCIRLRSWGGGHGGGVACGLLSGAPGEGLVGEVGESVVDGGVDGLRFAGVEQGGGGDTDSNAGKDPGETLHGETLLAVGYSSRRLGVRKTSAGGGAAAAAQGLEILAEHAGEVDGEAGALGVGVGAEGALQLDVLLFAGDLLGAGSAGEVGGG